MDFSSQKKQILSQFKRGDKRAIAQLANVSTVTVWNALSKDSLKDMTPYETKAWVTTVEYINKRLNGESKILDQTAKVAERI